MSNLIKRSNLTISEPKLITVEALPVFPGNLVPGETAEEFNDLADTASIHSKEKGESFLTDKIAEKTAELNALQTEITREKETCRLEVEAMRKEAEEECRQVMEQTMQEIENMKAQALEECMTIQSETYEKAYQAGLDQAEEDMESDRQLAFAQVKKILAEAEAKRLEIIQTAEPSIVELSMAVAKKVIATELASRPELIIDIVKEAIDNLDNPQNVRVQVNPKDELYLSGQGQFLTSNQYGKVNLTISPDESIERGGCIVESNMAVVDSRLETCIDNIQTTLNEVLINEG